MRKYLAFSFLLFVVFALATHCDNDGGADGGIFNSVPGNTPLDELTDEQAYDLCVELVEALSEEETQEDICMVIAVEEAQNQEEMSPELACVAYYAVCMKQDPEEFIDCEDAGGVDEELEDCDATVDELDQCVQDWIAAWESAAQDLDCADEDADIPEEPASCESLPDNCPDLGDLFFGFEG